MREFGRSDRPGLETSILLVIDPEDVSQPGGWSLMCDSAIRPGVQRLFPLLLEEECLAAGGGLHTEMKTVTTPRECLPMRNFRIDGYSAITPSSCENEAASISVSSILRSL